MVALAQSGKEPRKIPIGDASRRPVRTPVVTIAIIVVNALVFLLELAGGDAFINQWSFVPATMIPNLGASGAIAAVTLAPAIAQLLVQVWVCS